MTRSAEHDISQITDYLYISAWPENQHRDEILERNIRLILCMHYRLPSKPLRQPPLRLVWLPTIDSPLTPIPLASLERGAREALKTIKEGYTVLVHCKYGVHRSVAMACCVMIAMGEDAPSAMRLASEQRAAADPYAPHIQGRILRFEQAWKRT